MLRRAQSHILTGLAAIAILGLAVAVSLASAPFRAGMIVEDGPVEALSVFGYVLCIALLLRDDGDRARFKAVIVLLAAFALRELDFHNSYTILGITQTRFYISPDVPIREKLLAFGAIAALAVAVLRILWTHLRGFVRSVRKREPAAVAVLAGLSFIGIAKSLDGLSRKLADVGLAASETVVETATIFEETLELGIPAMFLIGIVAHRRGLAPQVAIRPAERSESLKSLRYWTIGWLSAIAIVLIRMTCRVRLHDDPRPALRAASRCYIYSVLHAHQVAAIINGERGTAAMVSRSADGGILIPSLWLRGIVAIRGSSRRAGEDKGGLTALDALCAHLAAGSPAYLAVDGPRGPRNRVQKGVAVLSRRSQAAVVNLVAIPSRRWILSRAWDRMQIPKPFATIDVYFGEPLFPLNEESSEQYRGRIESALRELETAHDPVEAERAAPRGEPRIAAAADRRAA